MSLKSTKKQYPFNKDFVVVRFSLKKKKKKRKENFIYRKIRVTSVIDNKIAAVFHRAVQ